MSVRYILVSLILTTAQLVAFNATADAEVNVKFSPNGGVADSIAENVGAATKTVDIAIYSFSDRRLQDSVVAIALSGVKVRVILHSARSRAALANKLETAGADVRYVIPVMHHKFAIIDFKRSPDAVNDTVLITGSANWSTKSDSDYDEDFVIAKNENTITTAFQAEFDHLWNHAIDFEGAAAPVNFAPVSAPVDSFTLFTSANFEAYIYRDRWTFRSLVEAEDGVAGAAIIKAIKAATTSIKIATTHFRRPDIYKALATAMLDRGVKVELITDQQEYRSGRIPQNDTRDIYLDEKLASEGATVLYKAYMVKWSAPVAKQMHSKYVIIDNEKVLSGSLNWSKNSEVGTFENLSTWTDSAIVNAYIENFETIKAYDGDSGLDGLLETIRQNEGRGPCRFKPLALTGADFSRVRRAFRNGACR